MLINTDLDTIEMAKLYSNQLKDGTDWFLCNLEAGKDGNYLYPVAMD